MSDLKVLEKEYPCLAAVNRCANGRTLFGPLIITLSTRSALPDTMNSSSCSCASSSGQSYQTAVLRRRTHPEDTHAGGEGETGSRSSAEHGSMRVWISLLSLWFQGITYDTGGADIKAGGCMAGMHRDKCGAAAVAGFFQVIHKIEEMLGYMLQHDCCDDVRRIREAHYFSLIGFSQAEA